MPAHATRRYPHPMAASNPIIQGMSPSTDLNMLPVTTTSDEARQHFELGRHAAFHYQPAQACAHLDAAISADSEFVLAYLHRGGMSNPRERKRYFDSAQANRGRVTEDERKMVDAFCAFLWEDDVELAVSIFHDLADRYRGDPYLPTYLGLRYLWNLGRLDEAKEQFQRALQRDPTFAQAHNWLGYVALQEEDYEGAEQAFRRYAKLAADQPRPHHSLGKLFLHTGRLDEARQHFEKASRLDPAFVDSRESLTRLDIEDANRRFAEAVGNQDIKTLTALYTESAQLLPSESKVLEGVSAIERYWQDKLRDGVLGLVLETLEVSLGANDHVTTELGRYIITNADEEVATGRYVTIWSLTTKGWKIRHSVLASG